MMTSRRIAVLGAFLGLMWCVGAVVHAAEVKPIVPSGAQIVGPYTPGLQVGNLLYVSGQGAGDAKGEFAPTVAGQLRQSLNNVKSIVEAVGLTMEHVVYAQLYATDASAYDALPSVWGEFFKEGGPALSRLGVTALPVGTPLEINAVAVTDIALKRAIRLSDAANTRAPPDAVVAGDRLFFSSCFGLDSEGKVPADSTLQTKVALDRMEAILKAAGIGPDHVVFVNPYITDALDAGQMNQEYARHFKFGDTPARATIRRDASAPRCRRRLHRGRCHGSRVAPLGAPQEHAAEPHREPVRLRRGYALLLGEIGLHSRAEPRRLRGERGKPGAADHAQSPGRTGGSRHESRRT